MKRIFIHFMKKKKVSLDGFILPLAMLLSTLILLVSFGITSIIVREAKFTRIVRDSFIAYNAADMAVTCVAFIDNSYTNRSTGYGIFPTSITPFSVAQSQSEIDDTIVQTNFDRSVRGLPSIALTDVKCGGVRIFDTSVTSIAYSAYTYTKSDGSVEDGKKSTLTLSLPLTNGDSRCAKVVFNKTPSFNQIIVSGYSTCEVNSLHRLERVIVSSAEGS